MASLVTDFVMVRFATRPYSFMRVGHRAICPWLNHYKIEWFAEAQRLFFELPGFLEEFVEITPELGRKLAPFSTEIKRKLSALQWTRMRNFRKPLSRAEIEILMDIGVPIIL